jgi:hypothetical protein
MHLEFLPGDQPDTDAQFGVPPDQNTTELLELCDAFFRQASPSCAPSCTSSSPNTVTAMAIWAGSSMPSASLHSPADRWITRPVGP